jgi:hypothetical protein
MVAIAVSMIAIGGITAIRVKRSPTALAPAGDLKTTHKRSHYFRRGNADLGTAARADLGREKKLLNPSERNAAPTICRIRTTATGG